MKYLVILGDGMADRPVAELGGKTPLEYANTPTMDALAASAAVGTVQTVPDGMAPGSDIANLAVLGYDPKTVYTGRAPLEALSVGAAMEADDTVFRCNLVTLSEAGGYEDKILLDHSAGGIPTKDADILLDAARSTFGSDQLRFYTGTSYRHILLWKRGSVSHLEPPHDHLGQPIGQFLPREQLLRQMMEESFALLNNHPLNRKRKLEGSAKANSLWFWGGGRRPEMESFQSRTGLSAAMIAGVDLLKGIAIAAQMAVIPVPGATGGPDTNYEGKAQAAMDALLHGGKDFVFVHVEAPDEMGHQGDARGKVRTIEALDSRLIKPIWQAMVESRKPFRLLILPDHPTPVALRTHTADPVPFLLYDSRRPCRGVAGFSEKTAAAADNFVPTGSELLSLLLKI